MEALERRLSTADRDRAARFRQPADLARFMAGRALLAQMLREELAFDPPTLEFALTKNGRPYLPGQPAFHFSITHAGDWVGVALGENAQVGIDIESVDRRVDLEPLAERIFNAEDLARFRALHSANRIPAFFRAWTGKEAVLKAKGIGLFGGVREIAVPLDDKPGSFREGETTWRIEPLEMPAGYIGTVAWDKAQKPLGVRHNH